MQSCWNLLGALGGLVVKKSIRISDSGRDTFAPRIRPASRGCLAPLGLWEVGCCGPEILGLRCAPTQAIDVSPRWGLRRGLGGRA
jgi:hypothetical protein